MLSILHLNLKFYLYIKRKINKANSRENNSITSNTGIYKQHCPWLRLLKTKFKKNTVTAF